MLALVRAAGRALALPAASRGIGGGGGGRPGPPLPLSSPLAGLSPSFRVREPPKPQQVDRWTEKRALFGVYDNVGILGERPQPARGHRDPLTGPLHGSGPAALGSPLPRFSTSSHPASSFSWQAASRCTPRT